MNLPAKQNETIDPETGEIHALPVGYDGGNQSLAVSLARAEVDQQIATARALPRTPATVMRNILSLATLDEKSAEECVYALPRGGKPIKGPSIRLAEIISSQWGNCRVGARVVHVDKIEKYVEAEGVFHDLETNTATTARVRRRISDSRGRLYNDDMIVVTGNAACSIAKRNAILGGVPKAVWRKAYDAVETVIAGDAATLVERREKAMKAFAAFGVAPERVCVALGVEDVDSITLEHMPVLMGAHAALKNQEATVEELFPIKGKEAEAGKPASLKDRLDRLADGEQDKKPDHKGDKKKDEGKAAKGAETKSDKDINTASTRKDAPKETTKGADSPDETATPSDDKEAAGDPAQKSAASDPSNETPAARATRLGRAAARRGADEDECPYDADKQVEEYRAWMTAFADEIAEGA